MKNASIAVIGIFVLLVVLVLLLPQSVKQQMQGSLFQWISPILRTSASVEHELGGVRGGLKRLDELERENEQLKSENEQLRASNSLLKNLETEVNRLNRALGFREQSPFKLLPARVIARDSATWWNVFGHFAHEVVYEARVPSGHGARWGFGGDEFIDMTNHARLLPGH